MFYISVYIHFKVIYLDKTLRKSKISYGYNGQHKNKSKSNKPFKIWKKLSLMEIWWIMHVQTVKLEDSNIRVHQCSYPTWDRSTCYPMTQPWWTMIRISSWLDHCTTTALIESWGFVWFALLGSWWPGPGELRKDLAGPTWVSGAVLANLKEEGHGWTSAEIVPQVVESKRKQNMIWVTLIVRS